MNCISLGAEPGGFLRGNIHTARGNLWGTSLQAAAQTQTCCSKKLLIPTHILRIWRHAWTFGTTGQTLLSTALSLDASEPKLPSLLMCVPPQQTMFHTRLVCRYYFERDPSVQKAVPAPLVCLIAACGSRVLGCSPTPRMGSPSEQLSDHIFSTQVCGKHAGKDPSVKKGLLTALLCYFSPSPQILDLDSSPCPGQEIPSRGPYE